MASQTTLTRLAHLFTPTYARLINAQIVSPAEVVVVKPNELSSALIRPLHLARYEPEKDPAYLAATLAYGVVKGHPFMDGNKRTAFFLATLYARELGVPESDESIEDIAKRYMELAAGRAEMESLVAPSQLTSAQT